MGENRLMADLYEENQRLKERIKELEEKHHNECGQIAAYDDELNGTRMDGDKANNVRNLTDEETEIYESWIDHEAKDTGVNIMDGDK